MDDSENQKNYTNLEPLKPIGLDSRYNTVARLYEWNDDHKKIRLYEKEHVLKLDTNDLQIPNIETGAFFQGGFSESDPSSINLTNGMRFNLNVSYKNIKSIEVVEVVFPKDFIPLLQFIPDFQDSVTDLQLQFGETKNIAGIRPLTHTFVSYFGDYTGSLAASEELRREIQTLSSNGLIPTDNSTSPLYSSSRIENLSSFKNNFVSDTDLQIINVNPAEITPLITNRVLGLSLDGDLTDIDVSNVDFEQKSLYILQFTEITTSGPHSLTSGQFIMVLNNGIFIVDSATTIENKYPKYEVTVTGPNTFYINKNLVSTPVQGSVNGFFSDEFKMGSLKTTDLNDFQINNNIEVSSNDSIAVVGLPGFLDTGGNVDGIAIVYYKNSNDLWEYLRKISNEQADVDPTNTPIDSSSGKFGTFVDINNSIMTISAPEEQMTIELFNSTGGSPTTPSQATAVFPNTGLVIDTDPPIDNEIYFISKTNGAEFNDYKFIFVDDRLQSQGWSKVSGNESVIYEDLINKTYYIYIEYAMTQAKQVIKRFNELTDLDPSSPTPFIAVSSNMGPTPGLGEIELSSIPNKGIVYVWNVENVSNLNETPLNSISQIVFSNNVESNNFGTKLDLAKNSNKLIVSDLSTSTANTLPAYIFDEQTMRTIGGTNKFVVGSAILLTQSFTDTNTLEQTYPGVIVGLAISDSLAIYSTDRDIIYIHTKDTFDTANNFPWKKSHSFTIYGVDQATFFTGMALDINYTEDILVVSSPGYLGNPADPNILTTAQLFIYEREVISGEGDTVKKEWIAKNKFIVSYDIEDRGGLPGDLPLIGFSVSIDKDNNIAMGSTKLTNNGTTNEGNVVIFTKSQESFEWFEHVKFYEEISDQTKLNYGYSIHLLNNSLFITQPNGTSANLNDVFVRNIESTFLINSGYVSGGHVTQGFIDRFNSYIDNIKLSFQDQDTIVRIKELERVYESENQHVDSAYMIIPHNRDTDDYYTYNRYGYRFFHKEYFTPISEINYLTLEFFTYNGIPIRLLETFSVLPQKRVMSFILKIITLEFINDDILPSISTVPYVRYNDNEAESKNSVNRHFQAESESDIDSDSENDNDNDNNNDNSNVTGFEHVSHDTIHNPNIDPTKFSQDSSFIGKDKIYKDHYINKSDNIDNVVKAANSDEYQ
jgi:hypothetical protein